MTGSSKLDDTQSDQTKTLFGVRYLHIQSDTSTPSRKQRRATQKFLQRRPDKGRLYGVPRG